MPRVTKRARVDTHVRFKVCRKKLARALELLERPVNFRQSTAMGRMCSGHILSQHCFAPHVPSTSKQQQWQELFRTAVTHHEWNTFIRALRLASQSHTFCGLDVLLRNTMFGILTHPMYRDPSTLRLFLYAVAPCRNEKDVEFCIQTILGAFNGINDSNDVRQLADPKEEIKTCETIEESAVQEAAKNGKQNKRDLE